jgi:hypothetical protein
MESPHGDPTSGSDAAELVAYLCARYDESEQAALATLDANVRAGLRRGHPVPRWEPTADGGIRDTGGVLRVKLTWPDEAAHITLWDPGHVLAEVESKRKILDEHGPETVWDGLGREETVCTTCRYDDGTGTFPYGGCPTVRALAAPYAGRPDFPAERKP